MPFLHSCPVFNYEVQFRPKIIVFELKRTLSNNLSNSVFLKRKNIKGKKGYYCLRARQLFSSRAGGLGLLNPHQCCFHQSGVSLIFFFPQCLSCAFSVLASSWLFSYSVLILALHSLASGGSRVSLQSHEGKSRCQNGGVTNVSHMVLEPKFLKLPGGRRDEVSLEVSQIPFIPSAHKSALYSWCLGSKAFKVIPRGQAVLVISQEIERCEISSLNTLDVICQ